MNEIISKKIKEKLKRKQENEKNTIFSKLEYINKKRATRCKECGDFLTFSEFQHTKTQEKNIKLTSANFCKIKWCANCSTKKVKEVAKEMLSIHKQIQEVKNYQYIFLTLTIANPQLNELRETLLKMSQAFFKLIKYKAFKKAIKGYFRSVEYLGDTTAQGQAHPHYHCILAVNPSYFTDETYINQAQWQEMWKKALKADYEPIVHITRIREKNNSKRKNSTLALTSAIAEVAKYSVAPLAIKALSLDNFKTLDKETKGIRQYNKGGLFKQFKPKDDDELDPEQWQLIQEYIFKYYKEQKNYILERKIQCKSLKNYRPLMTN